MQAASVLRRIQESGWMWTGIEELRIAKGLSERVTAALFDATIGLQTDRHLGAPSRPAGTPLA